MKLSRIAAPTTLMGWVGVCGTAHPDSVSGNIGTEWLISTPAIFVPLSLPAVQSIDSITIELAHINGNDLVIYLDAVNIAGEFDFDLMFQETAGGIPSFTMGRTPGDGSLANVAPYTFVSSDGGEFAAPHSARGTFNANVWTSGPLEAQDYVLAINDLGFLNGGAAGNWTVTYTPASASPADINGDGVVNVDDLLAVIGGWGDCPPPPDPCAADVNADGTVNVDDLLQVITKWG